MVLAFRPAEHKRNPGEAKENRVAPAEHDTNPAAANSAR
jgi:hypothetical protein